MSGFWDTIMNIEIFAFIGVLVWLYLKPSAIERASTPDPRRGNSES